VHHKVARERGTLSYVFTYAFHEGTVRALLEKRLQGYTDGTPLEGEWSYLRLLFVEAIPNRLRRFYRRGALSQIAVILINTSLVALGYLRGRVVHR
jgi:hypothetical protein